MAKPTIEWRGNRPYLSWSEGGRRWRRSLGQIDSRAAEKIRSAKEAELEHGVRILPRLPTVRQFLEAYYDWYDATHPTTGGKLRSETKRFMAKFGHRHIDKITAWEVERWKASRLTDDEASPETVGKEIRRLKTAFKVGIGWNELDTNPMAKVQAPRGVRDVAVEFYGEEDLKALYEANPDRAPLWRFMANTGMRRGEVAKATKDDVAFYGKDRSEKRIRIESLSAKQRTKSGRWREVPLNAGACEALDQLPDKFVSCHADTISDWFSVDAAEAKIGGTLHRLRHTFCAHLAMAGVPLRRIQKFAGHADYKTTEMYAHLCPTGGMSEVQKINL
ncbi:site-specific integrase [Dyella sp.]|uniref:tyrosine-type recombinase/integrase n=1 Tax=Dyella sp. TaxID=1869338 RepID=UPI0028429C60|nr:site-specific integrase [Dyella sp.]MDR3445940.1 site-specific integrase [Dyella sp.]